MGGVTKFPFPPEVWSPAGGWWNSPKNWKGNTLVAGMTIGILMVPIALFSARNYTSPKLIKEIDWPTLEEKDE